MKVKCNHKGKTGVISIITIMRQMTVAGGAQSSAIQDRHTHPDICVGNTDSGEKSKQDANTRVCVYHVSNEAK